MLLIVFVLILIVFLVFISLKYAEKKQYTFVLNNSIALKNLKKLNDIYSFYTINNFDSNYVYDNENYFDIISCEDYLIYILNEKQDSIKKEIKCIEFNEKKYKNYYDEILKIKKFGAYQNKTKFDINSSFKRIF